MRQSSLPSAFLNTSAVSPFASLVTSTSPRKEDSTSPTHVTSASAFASSGLSAFASSEQSPFGALGSSSNTASIFKTPGATISDKPISTGFAAAAGPSPFSTAGVAGFASLGSAFSGSAFGGGFSAAGTTAPLTSFASPGGGGVLGGTSEAKPFGVSGDGSEEEKEDEDEHEPAVAGFEKEKEDERFFQQQST